MILTVLFLLFIAVVQSTNLNGRVALVTGGSRGIGQGIAKSLANDGFVVYVTARSDRKDTITEKNLGGSLDELMDSINAKNKGMIIGLKCDHRIDNDIEQAIKTIESNHGRLDILVNNAFQVPSNENDPDLLFRNFWEDGQDGVFWDSVINVGLRSHYMTSRYAVPLMNHTIQKENSNNNSKEKINPVIFHISSFGGVSYSFNIAYGVGKCGVDRLAKDMAKELKPFNISCVSLYPGIVRTERMVNIIDSGEWMKRTGLYTPPEYIESPMLTGRVISTLYNNQREQQQQTQEQTPGDNQEKHQNLIKSNNGNILVVAETAKLLNIEDITGYRPPSIRSTKFLIPGVILGKYKEKLPKFIQQAILKYSPDILLSFSFMAGGTPEQ